LSLFVCFVCSFTSLAARSTARCKSRHRRRRRALAASPGSRLDGPPRAGAAGRSAASARRSAHRQRVVLHTVARRAARHDWRRAAGCAGSPLGGPDRKEWYIAKLSYRTPLSSRGTRVVVAAALLLPEAVALQQRAQRRALHRHRVRLLRRQLLELVRAAPPWSARRWAWSESRAPATALRTAHRRTGTARRGCCRSPFVLPRCDMPLARVDAGRIRMPLWRRRRGGLRGACAPTMQ
jgi:hypothetical protein